MTKTVKTTVEHVFFKVGNLYVKNVGKYDAEFTASTYDALKVKIFAQDSRDGDYFEGMNEDAYNLVTSYLRNLDKHGFKVQLILKRHIETTEIIEIDGVSLSKDNELRIIPKLT